MRFNFTSMLSKSKKWGIAVLVTVLGLTGCARIGDIAQKQADKSAYGIIQQKEISLFGESSGFTIADATDEVTEKALSGAHRLSPGQIAYSTPEYTLSLSDVVAIAIANNRTYITQKESLFSQALYLTETRRDYSTIFTSSADGGITRTEYDNVNGNTTVERFGGYGFNFGIDKILITGAEVSANFTHDFIRYFTNSPRPESSNSITFGIVQPLLQNLGPLVSHEPLTQAERNMIYFGQEFQKISAIFHYRHYFLILQPSQRV